MTLPGLSRPTCETSCCVTAVKKRGPTTVLKSTAYMIPVHGTYEEDRVGQPTREARDNDLNLEHSFQQGLSLEPTPWPWIGRRDTFHSSGYSECQLRMTLGEAGMRDAAEQLVDGQGSPPVPGKAGEKTSQVTE